MSSRSLCGIVFAVVGLLGFAGMTSDLRGSQPVPDSEAARLRGGSERTYVNASAGCNGTCNPTTKAACSTSSSYTTGTAGTLGTPSNPIGCGTCGAANNCSVVFQSMANE
jgi:hypothetical protein